MVEQSESGPRPATEARRAPSALGSLEALLMEAVWASASDLSVQEVCDALGPGHNYKTVMTVLNRLVQKELLDRRLDGRAFRYHARQGRTPFLRSAAHDLVERYMQAYGSDAATHLAGAIEAVAPRPQRPSAEPPPPPSWEAPWRDEPKRAPSLGTIVAVAAVLQALVFLLRRGRSKRR